MVSRYLSKSVLITAGLLLAVLALGVLAAQMLREGRFLYGFGAAALAIAVCFVILLRTLLEAAKGRREWRIRVGNRLPVTRQGMVYIGFTLLLCFAAAYSANNLIYLVLSCMLASMIVAGLVSRLGLAGLNVKLALPDRLFAGQTALARISIANVKRFLPSFSIRLTALESAKLEIEDTYFPILPPRETTKSTVETMFLKRGRYIDEGVTVKTRFPFGIVERGIKLRLSQEILVYPSIEPTEESRSILRALNDSGPGRTRGESHDLYRIRPAAPDDGARFIDWKAVARSGELWVREYASEDRLHVRISFDRRVPDDRTATEEFEKRVNLCAAIVWSLSESAGDVAFASDEKVLRITPETGDVFELLSYLAVVEPTLEPAAVPRPFPFDASGETASVTFRTGAKAPRPEPVTA